MSDRNSDEFGIINLDEDERKHLEQVGGEAADRLELAETAARIALYGLSCGKEPLMVSDPEGLVSLLFAKSARNVRIGVKGLKLGYYSGASAVIRSAFDDLAYATLFNNQPSEIAKWFRNEFSKGLAPADLTSFRDQQKKQAKQALFSKESSPRMIKDTLNEFINKANMRIHPSISGLSEEFGIDLEHFVSPELDHALSELEGDLSRALDRYVLITCLKDYVAPVKTGTENKGEPFMIELTGRYDEPTLSDLSLFAFYVAHRLLDFAADIFDIEDKQFLSQYDEWHKAVQD